jgi:ParB family chromosome partitioning protein
MADLNPDNPTPRLVSMAEIKQDSRNARRHNPRNVGQIERSIQRGGFGRSGLLSSDNVIAAGNATYEAATAVGMDEAIIVDSDGTRPVYVRRTDLVSGTPQFTEIAIADNRSAELADWDADVLASFVEDGIDLDQFWFPEELDRVISGLPDPDEWGEAFGSLPDGDKSPFQQMTFTVSDDQAEQVNAALSAAKGMGEFVDTGNENSNGNALARICETFLTVGAR